MRPPDGPRVYGQLALPRTLKVPPGGVVVPSDPQLPRVLPICSEALSPGLTLSVFTPFASPSPPVGRVGDVSQGDLGDIERAIPISLAVIVPTIGAGNSAHSPKLPHFSAVTAVDIPPTALEIN